MSSIPDRIEDLHNRLAQLESAAAARVKPAELATADRFVTRAELDRVTALAEEVNTRMRDAGNYLVSLVRIAIASDIGMPEAVKAELMSMVERFTGDVIGSAPTGTEA